MQNLVVINSLSHSGSTVLSMVLAGHTKLISLGEIFQILRDAPEKWLHDNNTICSCGATAGECNVWGAALKKIASDPSLAVTENKYENLNEKYQIVLETFNEVYGNDKIAIDTSKGFRHLKLITENKNIKSNIVFLIRDARAYATSQTRLARSQNTKGLRKIKQVTFYQLIRWYFFNKRRLNYIADKQIKSYQTSYEDLCFHSEATVKDICRSLDLEYQEQMIKLNNSQHHILFGNPMRLNKQKQTSITYDSRWLGNNDWALPYALLTKVRSFNKKYIYNQT